MPHYRGWDNRDSQLEGEISHSMVASWLATFVDAPLGENADDLAKPQGSFDGTDCDGGISPPCDGYIVKMFKKPP